MGKISPVSIKYIIHAKVTLTGLAEKPDVIGAVFGQTEGLLGSELELRELQKSGRIGRIEVNLVTRNGKTEGEIQIPSSMDKSETAIVAAAVETIERVGPCESRIKIEKIEDVRVAKRNFILERAKELLKTLVEEMPDSQALTEDVTKTVRALEVTDYGKDKLASGPSIDDSDEIIVVEGRADVVNLLRYGIRNAIALNGAKPCDTIINLTRKKSVTLFVDGDRGGDLIIKNMSSIADIDFVAKAPDGKEVEELTMKEIYKALRSKVPWEVAKEDKSNGNHSDHERLSREQTAEEEEKPYVQESRPYQRDRRPFSRDGRDSRGSRDRDSRPYQREQKNYEHPPQRTELLKKDASLLKGMAEDLIGSRGAFVLDKAFNILGKVPVKELSDTLKNLSEDVYAVVLDGPADPDLVKLAERKKVRYVIAKELKSTSRAVSLLTADKL